MRTTILILLFFVTHLSYSKPKIYLGFHLTYSTQSSDPINFTKFSNISFSIISAAPKLEATWDKKHYSFNIGLQSVTKGMKYYYEYPTIYPGYSRYKLTFDMLELPIGVNYKIKKLEVGLSVIPCYSYRFNYVLKFNNEDPKIFFKETLFSHSFKPTKEGFKNYDISIGFNFAYNIHPKAKLFLSYEKGLINLRGTWGTGDIKYQTFLMLGVMVSLH